MEFKRFYPMPRPSPPGGPKNTSLVRLHHAKKRFKTEYSPHPLHLAFGHCHALTEGRKEILQENEIAGDDAFWLEVRCSPNPTLNRHRLRRTRRRVLSAAPSYASNIPPCQGLTTTWVDGYWSQDYGRDTWVVGYWNRQPLNSGYEGARRFDNNFDDGDRRKVLLAASNKTKPKAFTGRDFNGQDRNQTRGFNQGRPRDFGNRNQNQNRGFGDQDQGWNRNGSTAETTIKEMVTETDSEAASQPRGTVTAYEERPRKRPAFQIRKSVSSQPAPSGPES